MCLTNSRKWILCEICQIWSNIIFMRHYDSPGKTYVCSVIIMNVYFFIHMFTVKPPGKSGKSSYCQAPCKDWDLHSSARWLPYTLISVYRRGIYSDGNIAVLPVTNPNEITTKAAISNQLSKELQYFRGHFNKGNIHRNCLSLAKINVNFICRQIVQ